MTDLNEIKEELLSLVLSGKKEEAIKLLQDKYGADRIEAEKLLGLAIKESVTPAKFFSTVLKGAPERIAGGKGCKHTLFKFIGIILGFIGIPPLLLAFGVYFYMDYQIKNSEIVTGVVIELRPYHEYDEPINYTPIIGYEHQGKTYSFEAPVYSDTPEFEMGEEVNLFVSNEDPNDVIIDTFTQKWFMIILIGSIGSFFTVGMIIFIFLSRSAIRQNQV